MNNHNIEREIKLNKLIDRLAQGGYRIVFNRDDPTQPKAIERQTLRELICGTLNISDQHTVNGWIDKLIGLGILTHNLTSDLTVRGYRKPTNESRYFINESKLTPAHITNYSNTLNRPSTENDCKLKERRSGTDSLEKANERASNGNQSNSLMLFNPKQ
jgi:hypothetical protein